MLQQAQTDYTNALAALKAGNLPQFQTDINMMQQQITQAQQVIGAEAPTPSTTTTTTTVPPVKGAKGSTKATTTTTTSASTVDHVVFLLFLHLRADEHRTQERKHHLHDAGLGGTSDLSPARRGFAAIPVAERGGRSHDGTTRHKERKRPMGLLDKVKAQATAATEMAKDAAAKGQAKMNEVQAKKAADGMLRDLGAAFYATKTGRATPTTDSDIDQLVASLQAHESEHGQITLAPESAAAAPTATPSGGTAAPAPPPKAADPALPTASSADGADAVAAGPTALPVSPPVGGREHRRGGCRAVHVGWSLRRGVEQSGSSSGS